MKGRTLFLVVGIIIALAGLFMSNFALGSWLGVVGGAVIGFFFWYMFED